MRTQLCDALVARSADPEMLFITGDLGFMALEPLQASMGARFINGGVAEQNMMTVAAALARQHFEVWVYSIAPFCYARPFEQIRNDIAFHKLPVKLIGNGGGYGYGVMGPTHHAIEDYGVLLTLGVAIFAPVFDEDIAAVIPLAGASPQPSYLRLGRGEYPKGWNPLPYAPWRQLTQGDGPPVIAVGPLAGSYIESFDAMSVDVRPNLWAVAQMPISATPPPVELHRQIAAAPALFVAEEHVAQGGFAAQLVLHLATNGMRVPTIVALNARSHTFERYGSQRFLREQSRLDPASMVAALSG